MKNSVKKILISTLLILFFIGTFGFGYYSGQKGSLFGFKSVDKDKPADVDFSLYWEVYNLLNEKSVATPDAKKELYGSISGLLSSIDDPYTTFFTPEENKRFKEDIGGEFSGIGVEITSKNNLPTVVAPISGSPAEKAGLKANDIIVKIDDTNSSDISFDDVIKKIRGAEGSKVKLTISRSGVDTPIEIEVVRKNIVIKSVEYSYENKDGKKIAVIHLKQFGDDTESLFKEAVDSIKQNKPDGIIIDLRNNPGGYLDTAVKLSSYFIPDGTIVSEKGKNGSSKDYVSKGNASLKDYKTVLLVNGGSASASEIFAGALRDRKGTQLIGETTFGKGSVQEFIDLSDGSAAKITIASWFTPNGTQINKSGLKPNIEVKNNNENSDDQLNKAFDEIIK